jgi:hypothetical protein
MSTNRMKGHAYQQFQFDLWSKQAYTPYRLRALLCDVHCGVVAVGLCCSRFAGLVGRNPKYEARNGKVEYQITKLRRPIYPGLLEWFDARVHELLKFVQVVEKCCC